MAWPVEPSKQPPPMRLTPGALPPPALEPAGVLWTSVPVITFGLGAPFSFAYGGVRARSPRLYGAALAYTAAYLAVFGMFWTGAIELILLGVLLLPVLWLVSSIHAFAVRRQVFPPGDRNARAVREARQRRELRQHSRQLAEQDPALARDLRIGRPELERHYDDGGLVDVNHCPAPVLAAELPGVTPDLAAHIVAVRAATGGFVSDEELAMDAELPPGVLERIAEYTVYLR